jgi:hypothetical protein
MFTFFVHLNATRNWLSLSAQAREEVVSNEIAPMLAQYPNVTLQFYDVEAFTTRCSDIAVFETAVLDEYTNLIDDFRSSSLITAPYFELVDIFPAQITSFV